MATMKVSLEFAGEVRAMLARNRKSVRQAAADMGKSQSYLARRVNGIVPFTVDEASEIAEYLGVPIAELLPLKAAS